MIRGSCEKRLKRLALYYYVVRVLDKKLKVIPKPKEGTRTVFVRKPNEKSFSTYFNGKGDLNLICGYCETMLCEGINAGQIRNIVLQCPVCNNYNEIP